MAEKQNIEQQIREAFQGHEMDVSSSVWAGIETQLGATTSVASAGSAFLSKAVAVLAAASVITAATISEIQHMETSAPEAEGIEVSHESGATDAVDVATAAPEQPVTTETSSGESAPEEQHSNLNASQPENQQAELAETAMEEPHNVVHNIDIQPEDEMPTVATEDMAQHTSSEEEAPSKGNDETNSETDVTADELAEDNSDDESDTPIQTDEPKSIAKFHQKRMQNVTPDGNGINDYLVIDGENVGEFFLQIARRNGQVVFQSDNPNVRWAGTDMSGNALETGTYFAFITASSTDGVPFNNGRGQKITINLVR